MSHFAYIFAAYCAAALGIIGLVVAIIWRGRMLAKKIALLEALDVKRKTENSSKENSSAATLQSDPL